VGSSTIGRTRNLSSSEAAAELGVCLRTLRRYIASERIRYHRLPGGHYRIPAEAIDEFWAAQDRAANSRRSVREGTRTRQPPERPTASKRRAALGREEPDEYDISPSRLAEIRALLAATRTP
jgi:excisionase family DNA binding protein